jgi:hypothetical protein
MKEEYIEENPDTEPKKLELSCSLIAYVDKASTCITERRKTMREGRAINHLS